MTIFMSVLRLALILCCGYAMLAALMWGMQRSLLYPAGGAPPDLSRAGMPSETRRVDLPTADGLHLLAWYAPPTDPAKPVLVLFHGNAGTIESRAYKVAPFVRDGYGALMVEYRGYGGTPGRPDETGLYTDAAAALAFLMRQEKIPPERIALWGESLGTGVAVQAAVTCAALGKPVRAVVLEAPYLTIPDVAAYHYPWLPVHLLLRDKYDSAARIAFINAPLLVLHGERDRTIPIAQGRKLLDLAKAPKEGWFSPTAGHMDLFENGAGVVVARFLSSTR